MESRDKASGQTMNTEFVAAPSATAIYVHTAVLYLFCVYIYCVCIKL